MAELGAAASIIALAGTAMKIGRSLYEIADAIGTAAHEAKLVGAEVVAFSSALNAVSMSIDKECQETERLREIASVVLNSCRILLKDLESELRVQQFAAHVPFMNSSTLAQLRSRIRWLFQKSKVAFLRRSLESFKSTLQLLLSTMTYTEAISKDAPNFVLDSLKMQVEGHIISSRDAATNVIQYKRSLQGQTPVNRPITHASQAIDEQLEHYAEKDNACVTTMLLEQEKADFPPADSGDLTMALISDSTAEVSSCDSVGGSLEEETESFEFKEEHLNLEAQGMALRLAEDAFDKLYKPSSWSWNSGKRHSKPKVPGVNSTPESHPRTHTSKSTPRNFTSRSSSHHLQQENLHEVGSEDDNLDNEQETPYDNSFDNIRKKSSPNTQSVYAARVDDTDDDWSDISRNQKEANYIDDTGEKTGAFGRKKRNPRNRPRRTKPPSPPPPPPPPPPPHIPGPVKPTLAELEAMERAEEQSERLKKLEDLLMAQFQAKADKEAAKKRALENAETAEAEAKRQDEEDKLAKLHDLIISQREDQKARDAAIEAQRASEKAEKDVQAASEIAQKKKAAEDAAKLLAAADKAREDAEAKAADQAKGAKEAYEKALAEAKRAKEEAEEKAALAEGPLDEKLPIKFKDANGRK